jgi:hypothetical protein
MHTEANGGQILYPNVIRPCKHSIKNILIFEHELDICFNGKTGFQTIFTYMKKYCIPSSLNKECIQMYIEILKQTD